MTSCRALSDGKALTRRGQGEQQASRAPLYRWADHRAPPPPIAGHRIAGHRIASIIAGVVEVRWHVGVWAWKYGKALDRGESNTGSVVPLSGITGHSIEAHHVRRCCWRYAVQSISVETVLGGGEAKTTERLKR